MLYSAMKMFLVNNSMYFIVHIPFSVVFLLFCLCFPLQEFCL